MSLLDHGQPADTTTKKHHTGLIAALAVLAVVLLAAGAWLIVDRQQQQPLSAEEQQAAIMDVVSAHRDALEVGDPDEIRATLTDDAVTALYMLGDSQYQIVVDNYGGEAAGDLLTFTDDPVFFGDLQVAIHTRVEYPLWTSNGSPADPKVGTYIFTLREVDGQLKIASVAFAEET
jgi:hypothetical protein